MPQPSSAATAARKACSPIQVPLPWSPRMGPQEPTTSLRPLGAAGSIQNPSDPVPASAKIPQGFSKADHNPPTGSPIIHQLPTVKRSEITSFKMSIGPTIVTYAHSSAATPLWAASAPMHASIFFRLISGEFCVVFTPPVCAEASRVNSSSKSTAAHFDPPASNERYAFIFCNILCRHFACAHA